MRFLPTQLAGAWIVELQRHSDDRGFFARTYCRDEFLTQGLAAEFVQCNVSYNERRGTVRGMHFQRPPHEEAKLIRCTAGSIRDVIVDLRPDSSTYLQHVEVTLSAQLRNALYVPHGFAHGFQTLEDATEVFYQMSTVFRPECAAGLRWNDPAIHIEWPLEISCISPRDLLFPDWQSEEVPV